MTQQRELTDVTIHLRSGQPITFRATAFSWRRNLLTGRLAEVNWSQASGDTSRLNWIRLDAIHAIETQPVPKTETVPSDGPGVDAESWLTGDVALAADGGLWVRAAAHDIEEGWPWAYCHGYAPQTGTTPPPEGAVEEGEPVRPLILLVRDGHPVGGAR